MAFVLMSTAASSALWLYGTFACLMAAAAVYAPQNVVRDRRTIAAAIVVLLLVVIGAGTSATVIYDYCSSPTLTDAEYYLFLCFLPAWMR